jgi:cob(I)alamin adenosyltransferase
MWTRSWWSTTLSPRSRVKIYTREGDQGQTRLGDGSRASKAEQRLECLGTIDELSACLGMSFELLQQQQPTEGTPLLLADLNRMQRHLSDLSAELAAPTGKPRLSSRQVTWLEREIDGWTEKLPALRNFILPGGGPAGACLHLARTICRRAERNVVRLAQYEPVAETSLAYLNRLSDALFVAARYAAKLGGFPERIVPGERTTSAGRPSPG